MTTGPAWLMDAKSRRRGVPQDCNEKARNPHIFSGPVDKHPHFSTKVRMADAPRMKLPLNSVQQIRSIR
jgi:hypothetical protein